MVMLWCRQIINGHRTYQQVPAKLKESVKNQLIELGYEDLVSE